MNKKNFLGTPETCTLIISLKIDVDTAYLRVFNEHPGQKIYYYMFEKGGRFFKLIKESLPTVYLQETDKSELDGFRYGTENVSLHETVNINLRDSILSADTVFSDDVKACFSEEYEFDDEDQILVEFNLDKVFKGVYFGFDGRIIVLEYLWCKDGRWYHYLVGRERITDEEIKYGLSHYRSCLEEISESDFEDFKNDWKYFLENDFRSSKKSLFVKISEEPLYKKVLISRKDVLIKLNEI